MTVLTVWDELVSVAVVGTERKPLGAAVTDGVRAVLGAEPPEATDEVAVLTAAGVLATYRRTGFTAAHHDGPPPAPAPADDRPLPSDTAVQLLELLLGGHVPVPGGTAPLVGEWLARAAATGRRLPDRLLPQLLSMATTATDRDVRRSLLAAGGPRLRWLASRNDTWSWAAAPTTAATDEPATAADAVWATGARDDRLSLLARLRATDPAEARRLVATTWSGEDAKDRAAIVGAFAAGLGPDDEPFLEAALDDRSRAVRAEAADLLARLPTSGLSARMAGRLAALVEVRDTGSERHGRILRRPRQHDRPAVEVGYPDELDPAARRDGIVDAGAPEGIGPKAWWLAQIVAATPLAAWDDLGVEPSQAAELAADRPELRHGLARAVRRQRDARWAAALLARTPDPRLLAVAAPADAERAVGPLLAAAKDGAVAAILGTIPGPWSPATSAAALARARGLKTATAVQQVVPILAAGLDTIAGPAVEQWVQDLREDDLARRHVRGLAHALSIRQTIAQELP